MIVDSVSTANKYYPNRAVTVLSDGRVEVWAEGEPQPAWYQAPVVVETLPDISPRQIRQALTAAGKRAAVEAGVAASSQDVKDWWEFATVFERGHPMIAAMLPALGITKAQADAIWIAASQL